MQEYVTLITRTKGPASSYTIDNLKSRLAAAEQRAKDSEAMMIQAAEYGKDLLEKNMALETDFEAVQQEKHELNLRLQVEYLAV